MNGQAEGRLVPTLSVSVRHPPNDRRSRRKPQPDASQMRCDGRMDDRRGEPRTDDRRDFRRFGDHNTPSIQSFQGGTRQFGPSVCAICLSRHKHDVVSCRADFTWDGKRSRCRRNASGRIVNPKGIIICTDWQRPMAVRPQMPNTSTSAPAAGRQITELTAVLSLRQHQAFTPLQADEWGHFLENAGLLPRYPNLLRSLRTGFIVGIPPIIHTVTPDNGPSIKMHEQEFLHIIEHELSVGRYLGPLSRAEVEILMGPFQSSPLSLIPKTEAGKLRLIQNFSFPKVPTLSHSSVNSAIDSSDYPCTWGTFTTFCLVLSHLPPGSQGAVRDVAEAYRNLPLAASQWPGAVVRIADGDLFVIDTSASLGLRPNAGVYGNVDDAACDIFRAAGIGPISKWVDDHVFIRIRREFIAEYNQRRLE
ncbi:hypothetical protein A0H81_12749 [Grifola frondosa]|uniref:Uncharacterized protein n=1 Tax=Grifola frondosa TaxID=5627 RepID=A0A1C7LRT5_GRIFR|nr:hypothetical protein A0H81_12749 [Grifola frondosa]